MEKTIAERLYELNLEQEQYFLSAHHTRLATYLGLASALLGATIAGAREANAWFFYAILCSGPTLVVIVAQIGITSTHRMYQRFLEAVTMRAKLEVELGLDQGRKGSAHWSASAPLVAARHLKDRHDSKSETEFIENRIKLGEQLVARKMFRAIQVLGVLLLVALAGRAVVAYLGSA